MTHERYRELVLLLVYGELDSESLADLEEHLSSCESCKKELEETRRFQGLLDRVEPPEALLQEARAQLHGALSAGIQTGELREPATARISAWLSRYAVPLASAAALLAGFSLGYLLFAGTEEGSSAGTDFLMAGDYSLGNIRLLDSDPADPSVQVSYDLIRPVQIRGDLRDAHIQEALVQALLKSRNPGVRLRVVDTIQGQPATILSSDVEQAMIHALKHDDNDGVRMRTLEFLKGSTTSGAFREALIHVLLKDSNARMRIASINALAELAGPGWVPDPDSLNALKDHLRVEQNDFVRLRSEAFLQEVQYK